MAKGKKNKKNPRRPSKQESQKLKHLADFVTKAVKDSAHIVPNGQPTPIQPLTLDAAVKGTFLEKVAEAFTSGKFIEPPMEMPDGAKVIGEATPLEKAFLTALVRIDDEIRAKVAVIHGPCPCLNRQNPGECTGKLLPKELDVEVENHVATSELLAAVLAKLVEKRFNNKDTAIVGFKIVQLPPESSDDSDLSSCHGCDGCGGHCDDHK